MQAYSQDREVNLFRREAFPGISYLDGEQAERQIYDAVRQAPDRSTFSMKLARAITDWPSEYHLSRRRHCLVRPLAIRLGHKVLELSCGGGAIHGILRRNRRRSHGGREQPAAGLYRIERCRDLPNVKIVLDDLLVFRTEEQFDWVLLVGVLGYVPVFSDSADPINLHLSGATQFLRPEGKVVIAV
jgi:hypothetical protein